MTASSRPRLLAVLGPTGSGKSELALALAAELGGEIVGCDAVQVYRGLDAATAKPSRAQLAAVRHHLVDCVDPRTDFSLADWVRAAEQVIDDIADRGSVPIVSGGTGLYLRGLLRGVLPAPPRDLELRERLRGILARGGAPRLHAWLARRDPDSARRVHAADAQRLVRAIELAATGATWSARLLAEGTWAAGDSRYPVLKVGLAVEHKHLCAGLDARVDRFFAAGLAAEVRALLDAGVPRGANAFKAIGYREVLTAIARGEEPDTARELVRRNTRRYAKRQRTWLRGEPGVVWQDADEDRPRIVARVIELWRAGAV